MPRIVAVIDVTRGQPGERLVWGIASNLDLVRAGVDLPCEAGERMRERQASHALVMDSLAQRPVGILSTREIAGVPAWGEA